MKHTNKKGFTIVELVIVIAVIAVLSAVLIPTFGSIIESANNAVDTQLVAQINTILAIEDVLGGGVNDAVEIQKVIKENGLKLETKSRGKYIWYDIENKKAVLAGLDENGLVLDGAAAEHTASADVNRPVLLSEVNVNETPVISEIPKGQFKAAISPENFVEGYLFLSTESADGLAEAIHALRNPEGNVEKTLTDALADLAKLADRGNVNGGAQVAALMQDFMNQTAIMTEGGTFYVGEGNNASITKVLVSSGMKKITTETLADLNDFPELYIVDLHSDVIDITDIEGVKTAGKIEDGKVNGIYFVYCNDEIKAKDIENGDIANLISVEQRGQAITKLQIIAVYLNKDANGPSSKESVIIESVEYKTGDVYKDGHYKHVVAYTFTDLGIENNEDSVFEFKKYSFYNYSNPNSIEIGTSNYVINEDEQMLIKDGLLTVYAYYQELNADFKIGTKCYSSAQVTSMLADNTLLPEGVTTITVISQTATLGSATETSLTIPSGVELLVPTYGYSTKKEIKDGKETGVILLDSCTNSYEKFLRDSKLTLVGGSYKKEDYLPGGKFNKDEITGETKLIIGDNVELVISSGAGLYVDAVRYHAGTTYQNFTNEKCGVLEINEGAKITSNGNVTAYGIIRGEGEIVANGGTVKETMTIYDWYGGSNAAASVGTTSALGGLAGLFADVDMSGKGVCPFNEWKVDNLRVKTTLTSGCDYSAVVGLHVSQPIVKEDFVLSSGKSDSNPLFVLASSSSIVKTLQSDGDVNLSLNGTVNDTHKVMAIDGVVTGVSVSIDFAKIPLPLSHIDIQVTEGSTLTISNNRYKAMPGSDIIVDGTLNIQGSAQVVMWNVNDVKFSSTSYTKAIDFDIGVVAYQSRNEITLILEDGKIKGITKKYQERYMYFDIKQWKDVWSSWSDKETENISFAEAKDYISISVMHRFSENDPAKLIVNGTLNFAGSAKFAGEITSTKEGTINAASTVGECSFPMGWFIQSSTLGNYWYDAYNNGLHSATVMVGVNNAAGTLAAGTYKFVSVDSSQGSTNMWQKQ